MYTQKATEKLQLWKNLYNNGKLYCALPGRYFKISGLARVTFVFLSRPHLVLPHVPRWVHIGSQVDWHDVKGFMAVMGVCLHLTASPC